PATPLSTLYFPIKKWMRALQLIFVRMKNLFRAPDKNVSAFLQRFAEFVEQRILRFIREINEDIAANDQIEVAFERVGQQIMALELNASLDVVRNDVLPAANCKKFVEKRLRYVLDGLRLVFSDLGSLYRILVD